MKLRSIHNDVITAVTVSYKPYPEPIVCNLLESIRATSELINEVIVVYGNGGNFEIKEDLQHIKIRHISPPRVMLAHQRKDGQFFACNYYGEHGFALKHGIDKASNDYILLTDPDIVFYYKGFDALYLDVFKQYNLNIIGVSHYLKTPFHWDFPTVINCLVQKSKLPGPDWLQGQLKHRFGTQFPENNAGWNFTRLASAWDDWRVVNGEYLLAGFVTRRWHDYLCHDCFFNTGCNLFLWDKDNGSRSATFRCLPNGLEYLTHGIWSPLPDFDANAFMKKYGHTTLLRHSMGYERTYPERLHILSTWLRESRSWMIPIG